MVAVVRNVLITKDLVDEFFGGVWCLSSNKPFDVGADADHDVDPEVLDGSFTTAGWDSCKNFGGSAALSGCF